MTSRHTPMIAAFAALAALAAGCDGDEGPISPGDTEPPRVTRTEPADGATTIPRDAVVTITFSEPVEAGTVVVEAQDTVLDASSEVDGDTARVSPSEPLPSGAEVTVRVRTDFEDAAGNALLRPVVFRFTVNDVTAPEVVASTPTEGDDAVSSDLSAVAFEFSEPMRKSVGELAIDGDATLGASVWSPDATRLTAEVQGLTNATAYSVSLSGFADAAGNALDDTPYLEDGALDFTTRGDDEAPEVASALPTEGQVDVSVDGLEQIEVTFDEPMDTAVVDAPLEYEDGSTTTLTGTWSDDARTVRFPADALRTASEHSVDLTGFADAAGNALAPAPFLEDGWLDFETGEDLFVPRVVTSTPQEGAVGVPRTDTDVVVAFSESMDTSITTVPVSDGAAPFTVEGTWEAGATVLRIPFESYVGSRTYRLDLTGMRDADGSALDASDPYLGDGVLDFTVEPPGGSSCDDLLLREHADDATGGVLRYQITAAQRTQDNGSGSCDPDGIADTDAVIRYTKTSPGSSDATDGRLLRVRTVDTSGRANVEVLRGVCDPSAATDADRTFCGSSHESWDQLLDVGAGDYYIWVSTASGTPSSITVEVDEVAPADEPAGESCRAPFVQDPSATDYTYTAPAAAGEPHEWSLPASPLVSHDHSDATTAGAGFACADGHTDDVVLEHVKEADDTLLEVIVEPTGSELAVQALSGACDPAAASATLASCSAAITGPRRFTVDAPAGPVYLWLGSFDRTDAFGGATVSVREVAQPTGAGTSCDEAIAVTPGIDPIAISPTVADAVSPPACMPVDGGVTWYRMTTTERLTHVGLDVSGAVGVVDAATGETLRCQTDTTAGPAPIPAFVPAGTELCIAVQTDAGATALTAEPIAYSGVSAEAVDTGLRPFGTDALAGTNRRFSANWIAIGGSALYAGWGTSGVFDIALDGSAETFHDDVDAASLGETAIWAGDALFSLKDAGDSPRAFRLATEADGWFPTIWDGYGAEYSEDTKAMAWDGAELWIVTQNRAPYSPGGYTSSDTTFHVLSAASSGPGTVLGATDTVWDVIGLAADDEWLYVAGRLARSSNTGDGVYRIAKTALADGTETAELLAPMPLDFTQSASLAVDDLADPTYLYARDAEGAIHVIAEPDGAFRYLGVLEDRGGPGDLALDYDRSTDRLYFVVDDLAVWRLGLP